MGQVMNPGWRLRKRHKLYEARNGDEISLLGDDVTAPSGHEFTYVHVECPYEVVFVVGIDSLRRVLMINQYRYVVGEMVWEVPAGSPEGTESLEEGARREFEEEGGYATGKLTKLGTFYSSVGITNQVCHVFMARDLVATSQKLHETESIVVRWVPLEEALAMVADGKVMNVGSAYGILLARDALSREASDVD
jgi:ADP-ribose pyrophosphatase